MKARFMPGFFVLISSLNLPHVIARYEAISMLYRAVVKHVVYRSWPREGPITFVATNGEALLSTLKKINNSEKSNKNAFFLFRFLCRTWPLPKSTRTAGCKQLPLRQPADRTRPLLQQIFAMPLPLHRPPLFCLISPEGSCGCLNQNFLNLRIIRMRMQINMGIDLT
ncbi:MAG: hypothetical protein JWR38_3124 [Mucilaginibacter sp.]|nr:hypothetical protein [Mucilaginibacter sp.]